MARKVNYPLYQWNERKGLFAFTSPTTMYRILNIGSNKNPGVTVDHYITRKMVLFHMGPGDHDITEQQFKQTYKTIFDAILVNIIPS